MTSHICACTRTHTHTHDCIIKQLTTCIAQKDGDHYTIVPDSELIVARSVDARSNSKYYVNGHASSFKEVTDLLKEKGIDLTNNRFLILQGEVEQISLMKPIGQNEHETGLLEYIEDIIGTNQYIEQIQKAEVAVEELSEVRTEKLNRLKGVESEKDSLEGARNEAVEYLNKKKKLIKSQHLVVQYRRMESQQKLEQNEERKRELKQSYDREKERVRELKDSVQKLETEYQETKQDYDKIAEELTVAKDNWTSFERKDIKLKQDLKNSKAKKKKLEESLAGSDDKIEELNKKIEKATKGQVKAEATLTKLSEQFELAEKSEDQLYKELQSEIEPYRIEKEAKQRELMPISKKVNEYKQKINVAQAEVDLLKERSNAVQTQYRKTEESLKQANEHLEKVVTNLAKSQKHCQQVEKRIPELQNQVKLLTTEESQLADRYQRARMQLQTLTEKMRSTKTQGKLLSALIEAKNNGTIPGIYDRLGNLGTIDNKYDVAVSTACGALSHIVVDSTESGIKCVELLRKENLGTATFIMLDKISTPDIVQRSKQRIDTPENVPRLFDLIKFKNERFRTAFYFALRDTLVATDLEQASRIAYQNRDGVIYRVVTLSGELIENTGTLSGGGNRVIRGGMSAQFQEEVSPRDMKVAEKATEESHALLRECQEKRRDVAEQLRRLEEEFSNLQTHISKIQIEQGTTESQIEDLKKLLAELEPQLGESNPDDDEKINDLNKAIESYRKSLSEHEELHKQVKAQIAKLQDNIENVGNGKLQEQKAKVQLLDHQIQECRATLTNHQVKKETGEKALAKLQKQLANDREQLQAADQQIEKVREELKALTEQAVSVHEQYEKAKDLMQEKEKQLVDKEKEYESIKKKVDESRGLELDLKNKLDDVEKVIKELSHDISRKNQQLKSLEAQIVECRYEGDDDDELHENTDEQTAQDGDNEHENNGENMEIEEADGDDHDDNKNGAAQEQSGDKEAEDGDTAESANEKAVDSELNESGKRRRARQTTTHDSPSKRQKLNSTPSTASLLTMLEPEQVKKLNIKKLNYEITLLESELEKIKPNLSAIEEYNRKEQEYNKKKHELDNVTAERDRITREREDLKKKRLSEFMTGFQIITNKLKEIYQMITLGGDAELELVDTFDPFREGIEFSVRPPKKSWKKISNLSGGEKTLSSLALVFALHHFKPTPIYVMDEIDAALDFKNVSIVANYIKERTKNAQFIVISLRNNMFEMADILVGIYKTDNCTKSVAIDPRKIAMPDMSSSSAAASSNEDAAGEDEPTAPSQTPRKQVGRTNIQVS